MKSIYSLYKYKYYLLHFLSLFTTKNSEPNNRCIMYHSIFKNKKIMDDIHIVEYLNFKKQISYLKKFNIVPINQINKKKNTISITFDDGYKDTFKLAYPILKKNNIPFAVFVITKNIQNKSKKYLNEEDIKKLSRDKNVIIGSHGKNHTDLTTLNNQMLIEELKQSKLELEKIIKKKVTCFSFPYGKFNQKIIKLSKKLGYKTLCNSEPCANNFLHREAATLNRQAIIYYDNYIFFKNKINGKFDFIANLKRILKKSNK
jgi:peptidoglycan/xylan/chitin deacetylase (PgdA/CDA1 family)